MSGRCMASVQQFRDKVVVVLRRWFVNLRGAKCGGVGAIYRLEAIKGDKALTNSPISLRPSKGGVVSKRVGTRAGGRVIIDPR